MADISVPMMWFLVGIVLILAELVLGAITYFFLFLLGLAALVTGAVAWAGIEDTKTLGIVFAVQAVICLMLSPLLVRHFTRGKNGNEAAAQTVVVERAVGNERYRVFYEGTQWDAQIAGEAREPGAEARILRREGNLLICN